MVERLRAGDVWALASLVEAMTGLRVVEQRVVEDTRHDRFAVRPAPWGPVRFERLFAWVGVFDDGLSAGARATVRVGRACQGSLRGAVAGCGCCGGGILRRLPARGLGTRDVIWQVQAPGEIAAALAGLMLARGDGARDPWFEAGWAVAEV